MRKIQSLIILIAATLSDTLKQAANATFSNCVDINSALLKGLQKEAKNGNLCELRLSEEAMNSHLLQCFGITTEDASLQELELFTKYVAFIVGADLLTSNHDIDLSDRELIAQNCQEFATCLELLDEQAKNCLPDDSLRFEHRPQRNFAEPSTGGQLIK